MGKESIWESVKGQMLLGEDEFIAGLIDYLSPHRKVAEISKSQRYANRPALEKLFPERVRKDKKARDRRIAEAVEQYGYTQRAIAEYLCIHFTYVSQIMRSRDYSRI